MAKFLRKGSGNEGEVGEESSRRYNRTAVGTVREQSILGILGFGHGRLQQPR